MKKEIKSLLKKTVKVAGVTCIAAGAVALMTSAVAVKALAEGGRYLKDTVQKILKEEADTASAAEEIPEEQPSAEEAVPAQA